VNTENPTTSAMRSRKRIIKRITTRSLNLIGHCVPSFIWKNLQDIYIYSPRKKALGIDSGFAPLFNSVLFEVRTRCNGTCPFCAASTQFEKRKDTIMPKALYIKVINELKNERYKGRIAYHVNNDPLLFPDLPEFVKYARTNLPSAWIQILTNGKLLTETIADRLMSAGINELTINLYSDDLGLQMSEVLDKIREKIIPQYYQEKQIQHGYGPGIGNTKIFRFNVFRQKLNVVKSSRAGTAPNKRIKSRYPRGFCEHPFTQFNITADGRVAKCCADFYFSDPMGNLKEQSVMEIWNEERFQNVRKVLLEGNRDSIETCRKCDYYGAKEFSRFGNLIRLCTQ